MSSEFVSNEISDREVVETRNSPVSVADRPTVLVLIVDFRPSFAASGPNRSWTRIVSSLSDRFHFRFISSADPDEETGVWHVMDGCERIALRRNGFFVEGIVDLLRNTHCDLMISNSFFDPALTLPALLLHRIGVIRTPVIVAPRGEFSPAALMLKPIRKRCHLRAVKLLRLLKGVDLQATDEQDAAKIRAEFKSANIVLGPNIRPLDPLPPFVSDAAGGSLRIVFMSRIDNMKNLEWALRMLAAVEFPIVFNIYGPISNQTYWEQCRVAIEAQPPNVQCHYHGALHPDLVPAVLAQHDLMLLPTRGENFGHAIVDAFLAGTPVLIADTTPWRGLAGVKAGADLPLDDVEPWIAFVRRFAAMAQEERLEWRAGARRFAEQRLDTAADTDRLAACFQAAMALG